MPSILTTESVEKFDRHSRPSYEKMSAHSQSSTYNRSYERKVVEEGPTKVNFPYGMGIDLPRLSSFQAPSSSFLQGPHNYHFGVCTSGSFHSTDDSFSASLDVSAYAPEDLKVSVIGRQIVIEAKHPEKTDELGTIERSFVRKFALPKHADPEAVQSNLSAEGVLTVEVLPPKPKEVSPSRSIPIKIVPNATTNGNQK
uniref:SHSP domain-containing protein n=1 Tax=Panagrolaimus sp. JU765 TaxID=591449 RepID=A0AC34RA26_9BILA